VRLLIVAAVVAGVIVFASLPWVGSLLHPPLCSTVESGGVVLKSFCISWEPMQGRYETPPSGVPADYGAYVQPTIDPTVLAVSTFVGATLVLWIVLSVVSRLWRTSRGRRVTPSEV
jgi:hypothetical protein